MKEKTTKLVSSVMVLVLCLSMFLGTTLAWFNDAEGSGNNQITAGNLDVTLEYLAGDTWVAVDETTNVFQADALWEPGHTEVVYLRTGNAGTLALQYQLGIRVAAETASVNADGERLVLSDHIQYAILEGVDSPFATREDALAAVTAAQPLSSGYTREGVLVAGMAPEYLAMVVFMPETVGNEANYATGAVAPSISLGIRLQAVQMSGEADGFGDSYDSGVQLPGATLDSTITEPVLDKAENGVIVEEITVGDESDAAYAQIPQGVTLADGAQVLTLSVQEKAEPEASITVQENESVTALDIHVEGLAANNTVPMLVTLKNLLPTGLNTTSVTMYHVENGQPVAMTYAANPVNHNEFSYDAATGTVVLCVASFSEYVAVTKNLNLWEGGFDVTWYNTTDTEFTLTTADQLAGFGAIVDGGGEYTTSTGVKVQVPSDMFLNKTIYLGKNIDLSGGVSFNPIGCGYHKDTNVNNSNGVEGRAFMGTFDGNGYTISNLYQNGWDIGLEYCNLGGGLFASIANGTVQNLTITGADIRMECVELGVLVGLSQGACTYKDITIMNSKIANYQRATGGLIGEVSALYGTKEEKDVTTISNVYIASNVTVGSMWGDFDAPCGGVIGARWDDDDATTIVMEDCVVSPRMDVYNDVTSSYQWYAYRRAGMLIGNTDIDKKEDSGRTVAAADFLTCNNVTVYYGPWVNYHYCEFSNNNPNWPFVRAEAGNYCEAFSNPRYGVPVIDGTKITPENHNEQNKDGHEGDDDHWVTLPFGQLYGGGQGVYGGGQNEAGESTHTGVTIGNYKYTITYMYDGKILHVSYINDNSKVVSTENSEAEAAAEAALKNAEEFGYWVNAASVKTESVDAGNTKNIVLYPSFKQKHTAMFVDQEGNVLASSVFVDGNGKNVKEAAESVVYPAIEDCVFSHWAVHVVKNGKLTVTALDKYTFSDGVDITIYPVYTFDGDVNLIPVDNDQDGITDEYYVGGYSNATGTNVVNIPGTFNGKEITTINAGAFCDYDGVHSIIVPLEVKTIGKNAFSDSGEEITIYYAGSYAQWLASGIGEDWKTKVGTNTRVFFMNGTGKVVPSEGYVYYDGGFLGLNKKWKYDQNIPYDVAKQYTGACSCDDCKGADRPDKAYWEGVTLN